MARFFPAGRPHAPAIRVEPQMNAAKQQYAEMFAEPVVVATYLKLALVVLSLATLAVSCVAYNTAATVRDFQPLVIRIDDIGRAEAVRYDALEYTPREAEIKYFLSEFCRYYYGRNRVTLAENFSRALALLHPTLAKQVAQAWEDAQTITNYMGQNAPDIEVLVRSVTIEDLRAETIRARVDFELVIVNPADRQEMKRLRYTANFALRFRRDVLTADILQRNPLGMAIEYFREDLAIQ